MDEPGEEYPPEALAERVPIAAVTEGVRAGDRSREAVVVVCSDGAAFRRQIDGGWLELEPIPGTPRAVGGEYA